MKHFIFIGLMVVFISCKEKFQAPKLLVENFFENYKKKGVDNALDDIFQTNEYVINQSQSDIKNLKESLTSHISAIGNYRGYEIISECPTGKSIIHYCCIVKYDKQPLRFNFIFYKAGNSWVLYSLNFDNNIINELDEMAKYHYY